MCTGEGNKENGPSKNEKALGNESDEDYEKNIKKNILSASLNFVNEYGWSQQAISAGNFGHSCYDEVQIQILALH